MCSLHCVPFAQLFFFVTTIARKRVVGEISEGSSKHEMKGVTLHSFFTSNYGLNVQIAYLGACYYKFWKGAGRRLSDFDVVGKSKLVDGLKHSTCLRTPPTSLLLHASPQTLQPPWASLRLTASGASCRAALPACLPTHSTKRPARAVRTADAGWHGRPFRHASSRRRSRLCGDHRVIGRPQRLRHDLAPCISAQVACRRPGPRTLRACGTGSSPHTSAAAHHSPGRRLRTRGCTGSGAVRTRPTRCPRRCRRATALRRVLGGLPRRRLLGHHAGTLARGTICRHSPAMLYVKRQARLQ